MAPEPWSKVSSCLLACACIPLAVGLSPWAATTSRSTSFGSSSALGSSARLWAQRSSSSRSSSSGSGSSSCGTVSPGPGGRSTPTCSLDDLRTAQSENGGVIGDVSYDDGHVLQNVLVSGFEAGTGARQRADAVADAAASGTLLVDKSHWGVIRVEGEDRLRFLHSQGTNAFERATVGQVVATCFTNNIGRVVDFCEGVVLDDAVWLISSPHRWQKLLGTMDKFIFPMDKTTVSSLSEELAVFSLAGPKAAETMAMAKCASCPEPGRSVEWEFEGEKVLIIGHARPLTRTREEEEGVSHDAEGVLSGDGERQGTQQHPYYSVIVPVSVSSKVWSALSASPSVVAAGEEEWQTLRIKQGFPFPGKELTADYNPLEAGLWHAVHFDKGCYIGQESISRVNAYNAVSKALYGVSFEDSTSPEQGTELFVQETGKSAGVVTSMLDRDATSHPFGLAYIRTKAGGVGLKLSTKEGEPLGTVVQVPYPTRSDAESAMPPAKKEGDSGDKATAAAAVLGLEEEKAKEKARKAAKLEAMQKKIDALKARRKTS
ncbi:folate-binding protein YgfZ [Ectocarpus siliculosus]|uniref:Folate-binding protein YgfZ n=1 Tax=Ectocarpus siliculosus TaxID=2880 RepID=D8LH90_ECTSI|nr:folate-binding protein YgfZ [Ectocarpus siliculosus]|eukprot:CBN74309.1 folate-binding protein YgfZ [Ectocarpus siliculosus]